MKTIKKFCLIFGSHSGRYENKIKKSGLIPTFLDDIPCFYQSNLVLICKKLYKQDLTPSCFFNKDLDEKIIIVCMFPKLNMFIQNKKIENRISNKKFYFLFYALG